jgi:hypothetical protein
MPLPGAPKIVIRAPDTHESLASPVSVAVDFVAEPDARIDPESIRIYYGWLDLDVTDRIRKHATITEAGIAARDVDLPAGSHEFHIRIADTKGRQTDQNFKVTVRG